MAFWVLLLRILVLILSFLLGGSAKSLYDYHYKPLPLVKMPCKCKCADCKCNQVRFPLLRRQGTHEAYKITQAEVDRLAEESLQELWLPSEHGWTPPSEREQRLSEIEAELQKGHPRVDPGVTPPGYGLLP